MLSGTPTAEVEPNNDTRHRHPDRGVGVGERDHHRHHRPRPLLASPSTPGTRCSSPSTWTPTATPPTPTGTAGSGSGSSATPATRSSIANDGSTTKPHAEAFFITVKNAGTYYPYVDSTVATGLGADARYHLSVRVIPKQVQTDCTVIASTDVPGDHRPRRRHGDLDDRRPGTVTASINDLNLLLDLDPRRSWRTSTSPSPRPAATSIPLFTDVGATATGGQVLMDLELDDTAAIPIGSYTVVSGMVHQPEQPGRLSALQRPAGGRHLDAVAGRRSHQHQRRHPQRLEPRGLRRPRPRLRPDPDQDRGPRPGDSAPSSTSITVAPGATVYYCYTVTQHRPQHAGHPRPGGRPARHPASPAAPTRSPRARA